MLPLPPSCRWKGPEGADCHFSRLFDFMQPKKGMCSVNAHCLQEQRFSVHPGGVFVMQTDMRMEHIPYADYFKVQSFWKVRWVYCRPGLGLTAAGDAWICSLLQAAPPLATLRLYCVQQQVPSNAIYST